MDIPSKKFIKENLRLPLGWGLALLSWIERKIFPEYKLHYNPVFIIGPPRSGTTLLHQLITSSLSTSYFTNLAIRLRVQGVSTPPVVLSAWLAKQLGLIERRKERFKSHYGRTKGWGNPGDSAMIWQHWFSNGYYTGSGELSPERHRLLYQAVAGTERIFGYPFVDKTTDNSVRIRALIEIFPTALFIQCVRSPLAVVQSIYIGRLDEIEQGRPPTHTTYAKPKEFKSIRYKNLIEQSCELFYYIEQNIAQDKAALPKDRCLEVDYEAICLNPQQEINRIASFMNAHGLPVKQIHPPPPPFRNSRARKVDPETYEAMVAHLEKLYGHEIERLDEPRETILTI